MPIYAVMPAKRLLPARVRVVLDALTELGAAVDLPARPKRRREPTR
jgi:hypothetical protein